MNKFLDDKTTRFQPLVSLTSMDRYTQQIYLFSFVIFF
jgi:hypothetical protein